MKEVKYKIIQHLADLGEQDENGWVTQLNIVQWGHWAPAYDIRKWQYDENSKVIAMSKGIVLHEDQFKALIEFCKNY